MKFKTKLVELCRRRNIDRSDVVRHFAAVVSKTTVYAWFNGQAQPSLEVGLQLARLLEVPLDYLADDALDEPKAGLTPEQREILRFVDALGPAVALNRIMGRPDDAPPTEYVRTLTQRRVKPPPMFPDDPDPRSPGWSAPQGGVAPPSGDDAIPAYDASAGPTAGED